MRQTSQPVNLPSVHAVERLSIIDQAEIQLRGAIYDGALRPGDQVPEIQVAKQMGISRSSLREACQRLVRDGLLRQQPGRGVSVTRLGRETVGDFIQYRMAVEMQAIRILTGRIRSLTADGCADAVAELLAPLEQKADVLRAALDAGDLRTAADADLELHQGLVEQTGNRFLTTSMYTIAIMSRIAAFSDPLGFALRTEVEDQARELLLALRNGDETAAGKSLEQALATYIHRLDAGVQQDGFTRGMDAESTGGEPFQPLA